MRIAGGIASCEACGRPIETGETDPRKVRRKCKGSPAPPAEPRPATRSLTVPCSLRGADPLREMEATKCGMQGEVYPVYSCPVHGECVLYLICNRQTVKACEKCNERAP